jgi:hypothetical protein
MFKRHYGRSGVGSTAARKSNEVIGSRHARAIEPVVKRRRRSGGTIELAPSRERRGPIEAQFRVALVSRMSGDGSRILICLKYFGITAPRLKFFGAKKNEI